jgi:hypothetical protein
MNLATNKKNILLIVAIAFAFVACGGGGDTPPTNSNLVPEKSILSFPLKNEVCETGVSKSDTETEIEFKWAKSNNTTSYKIVVTNLSTKVVADKITGDLSHKMTLSKGTNYSWYVESKSSRTTEIATSETWNFYISGTGTVNHIPFPAEITSPLDNAEITTTKVTLEWLGSDVDNDIKEYKIYMDETANPTVVLGTYTTPSAVDVAVVKGKTYYWKVVTFDTPGNSSTSSTYSFKVN